MIPKTKGAEDKCPSCGMDLVCREKEYKGNISLQWQYKDKEEAHFNFDFATKKSSCKESGPKKPNDSVAVTYASADQLNISEIEVKGKEEIMELAEDGTKRCLIIFSAVQRLCKQAGISHPATVGMIFNQVCENRRASI